jgi:hypothetical protein
MPVLLGRFADRRSRLVERRPDALTWFGALS